MAPPAFTAADYERVRLADIASQEQVRRWNSSERRLRDEPAPDVDVQPGTTRFIVTFQAGNDALRRLPAYRLKLLLKRALRDWALRAIRVEEVT